MIESVGLVGLGKMGHPMARHLITGGFSVAGYDLDAAKCDAARELGVSVVASPKEVAEASDLIIVIVGFDEEVFAALGDEVGVYAGLREEAVIAIASTVAIDTMGQIEDEVGSLGRGSGVLDIPICRGEPAAEAGDLLLLAGGDAALFERCNAAFSTFASEMHLLGGLGAGQVGKLVNNLLLWSCITANYEGLKLGEALGVDPERLRKALLGSSGRNWALETWDRPRAMPWAEKDMRIVMEEADRVRLSLPVCGVVKEAIKALKIERGLHSPGSECGPRVRG